MPTERVIGWDIGGANLKAIALDRDGRVLRALQLPCTLWRGVAHLDRAIQSALREIGHHGARHVVTMTGELADCFVNRSEGVTEILRTIAPMLQGARFYSKGSRFLTFEHALESPLAIASGNWHASATYLAKQIDEALLLDIGSTTTDITPVGGGRVHALGNDDHTRLANDELVYCGVVRTPLVAIASRAPFRGSRVNVMAEYFATTADVYRLTGELPDAADHSETADGREKTVEASARRIARMIGCDFEGADIAAWRGLADFFAGEQLHRIAAACETALARNPIDKTAPIVGAGVGDFLARKIATGLDRPYRDFASFAPSSPTWNPQCAPAFAVAWLLQRDIISPC
ncbi:MAG: hydantoinase/oxoprolinase family protein [Burkholderiales bacterium]